MLKKGFKKLVLNPKTDGISFYVIHLPFFASKNKRKKKLIEISKIINKDKSPKIVCGDFNFHSENEIVGFLEITKLKNAWEGNNSKINSTFPSWKPTIKKKFDYVLYSQEIIPKDFQVMDVRLSDHLPIVFDFSLK